jgi:nucleotide-binding universal stress UspA family protein
VAEEQQMKILVALDGSRSSEKALQVAVKLAQQDGGRVTAVTVLERTADPHLEGLAEGFRARARHQLEELLQAAANFARSRGVHLTPLLREGHPAEAILHCAEQEGAELLVVGSRNGPAPGPGLGGTADQVSSHAPCTVMLVR